MVSRFLDTSIFRYVGVSVSAGICIWLSYNRGISGHQAISVSRCLVISAISRYLGISLSRYLGISVFRYLGISSARYLGIPVSLPLAVSLSRYLDVSVSLYLCNSVYRYLCIWISCYRDTSITRCLGISACGSFAIFLSRSCGQALFRYPLAPTEETLSYSKPQLVTSIITALSIHLLSSFRGGELNS